MWQGGGLLLPGRQLSPQTLSRNPSPSLRAGAGEGRGRSSLLKSLVAGESLQSLINGSSSYSHKYEIFHR